MNPLDPIDTAFGELVINSLSAHTFAWCAIDIRPLYYPAGYRGDNAVIPGAPGERENPYRIGQAQRSVPFYFTDNWDPTGSEYLDRFAGYEANIALINDAWLTPPSGTSFDAYITTPSGETLTPGDGGVQVLGFEVGSTDDMLGSPFLWRASLALRIPAGLFS